jgi:hypothetical protein
MTQIRREVGEQLAFNLLMAIFGPEHEFIPASELRVGDVIAPCGDRITSAPQYIADDDVWLFTANCPDNGLFEVRQVNVEVPVFGRE